MDKKQLAEIRMEMEYIRSHLEGFENRVVTLRKANWNELTMLQEQVATKKNWLDGLGQKLEKLIDAPK